MKTLTQRIQEKLTIDSTWSQASVEYDAGEVIYNIILPNFGIWCQKTSFVPTGLLKYYNKIFIRTYNIICRKLEEYFKNNNVTNVDVKDIKFLCDENSYNILPVNLQKHYEIDNTNYFDKYRNTMSRIDKQESQFEIYYNDNSNLTELMIGYFCSTLELELICFINIKQNQ